MVKTSRIVYGWFGTGLILTGLIGGCDSAQNPSSSNGETSNSETSAPQIVATHPILCNLVEQIVTDTANLRCLIPPGTDPHSYKISPTDRQHIETAQVVFYNGYTLEPGLEKIIQAAPTDTRKVPVAEQAIPTPLMNEEEASHSDSDSHHSNANKSEDHDSEDHDSEDHDSEDHDSEGAHQHGDSDPHVWQSAQNGIKMAEVITAEMKKLLPEQTDAYEQKLAAMKTELTALDTWIQTQVNSIPKSQRVLFTTHEALGYYGKTYGLTIEGSLQGLNPDQKPSASRVKTLVDEIKASGVKVIFTEQTTTSTLLDSIAKDAGAKLSTQGLLTDTLNPPGQEGSTYQSMLKFNTKVIVEGLGGSLQPFSSP